MDLLDICEVQNLLEEARHQPVSPQQLIDELVDFGLYIDDFVDEMNAAEEEPSNIFSLGFTSRDEDADTQLAVYIELEMDVVQDTFTMEKDLDLQGRIVTCEFHVAEA